MNASNPETVYSAELEMCYEDIRTFAAPPRTLARLFSSPRRPN